MNLFAIMKYNILHVCVDDHVIYREVHFKREDAERRSRELINEQVWKINNTSFYFGDVHVKIYNLDMNVTCLA